MAEDAELGRFLKARREQLQPSDVGLPAGRGRRRTPGLRREEVATLAGISIDYLVRLEQGRDVNPSAEVLASLSQALRLNQDERFHMMKLVARAGAGPMCPTPRGDESTVAPTVQILLDRLGPTPAFVLGPFDDVLAWNRAWERVVTPLGMLDGDDPNLARYVFTHPKASTVLPDWELSVDEHVARLRVASVRWGDDARLATMLDEFAAVPAFSARWSRHLVEDKHRGVKRIVHPDAGELRIAYDVLLLPDDGEQRLTTWLPADDATAHALDGLLDAATPSSPARLRVIGQS
jgi:transcriptional regulator with XRE-family HTH domain